MTQNGSKEQAVNRPLKKFRAGPVVATVWNNHAKDGEGEYKTVSFERGYKDKDGAWKTTSTLRVHDLPRASLVLRKAYEFIALGSPAET